MQRTLQNATAMRSNNHIVVLQQPQVDVPRVEEKAQDEEERRCGVLMTWGSLRCDDGFKRWWWSISGVSCEGDDSEDDSEDYSTCSVENGDEDDKECFDDKDDNNNKYDDDSFITNWRN